MATDSIRSFKPTVLNFSEGLESQLSDDGDAESFVTAKDSTTQYNTKSKDVVSPEPLS